MPASFEIQSSTGAYGVEIRRGLLADSMRRDDTVVVCDERFADRFSKGSMACIALPAEETVKSLEAMPDAISRLRELGATRKTHLLAVGGGIVQDVAAFMASVYMRGLGWSYVPTTLLGMVDSCIGGKSSINVGRYKNLVGTFHPPEVVLVDPELLDTLPVSQRAAGLCEAIKICFARGPDAFDAYLAERPAVDMPDEGFERVIETSLRSKKWFIEIDEFDAKERILLNFGHTFGHALEGASKFAVGHGLAVGLGILCAADFGRRIGRDYDRKPRVTQLTGHIERLLSAAPELPTQVAKLTAKEALHNFLADKKHERERFAVIVIGEDGALERLMLPKSGENLAMVEAAFQSVIDRGRA